jgi:hypothetical protein
MVDLGLRGGPSEREIITDYPEKAAMVLQRTRGPLLKSNRGNFILDGSPLAVPKQQPQFGT